MSKSFKFKNDNYLDSSGVIHKQHRVSYLLNNLSWMYDIGKNIDNLTNSGIYQVFKDGVTGTYPTNLGCNQCTVIVSTTNVRYNAQLAFGFGGAVLAYRSRNNTTTWSDWKYFNF